MRLRLVDSADEAKLILKITTILLKKLTLGQVTKFLKSSNRNFKVIIRGIKLLQILHIIREGRWQPSSLP